MLTRARAIVAIILASALVAIPAYATKPQIQVGTLGSVGITPAKNGRAGAIFYGQVNSQAPVVAWFEFQVGCGQAFRSGGHARPVRSTRHQYLDSTRGGRKIKGTGHGLPVQQSSCYRVVAEPRGSQRPVYGDWRLQPNFGPHGGPSEEPLPKQP